MNENLKTLIFVAAAAAVGLIAWATMPASQTSVAEDFHNQLLYPKFTNPLDAASLEIVKYDEAKGEPVVFKVAEVEHKGKARWSIPSHDNYPADARDQVASAATALMGLQILDMVSDDKGDESVYGVVDPDPDQLSLGATGVGQRVVMQDKNGKDLLNLVVGKQVPNRPNLCYVRKVGHREIYTVEAKTDKLSDEVRGLDRAESTANQHARPERASDRRLQHQGDVARGGHPPKRQNTHRLQRRRRSALENARRSPVRARR